MFSSQKTVVDLGMPARPGHDTALSIIPAKSGLTRVKEYGLAVGVTLLALLARFLLDPYLGDRLPYETFFVAVGVTAWYGGLGASLTAVLLGAVLSNWFFTAPREAFGVADVRERQLPVLLKPATRRRRSDWWIGSGRPWW